MRILICFLVLVVGVPLHAFGETGGNKIFKSDKMDPVTFSHDYHTKNRGISCRACHNQQFLQTGSDFKMKHELITKNNFCEHCHNGMKAFDARSEKNCVRCHIKGAP